MIWQTSHKRVELLNIEQGHPPRTAMRDKFFESIVQVMVQDMLLQLQPSVEPKNIFIALSDHSSPPLPVPSKIFFELLSDFSLTWLRESNFFGLANHHCVIPFRNFCKLSQKQLYITWLPTCKVQICISLKRAINRRQLRPISNLLSFRIMA